MTGRIAGTVHPCDQLRVFDRPAAALLAEIEALVQDLTFPCTVWVRVEDGSVTVEGEVNHRAQAAALVRSICRLEGVIDVTSELTHGTDDLMVVPPLL